MFRPSGQVEAILQHPEPVYGCDFNPFDDNLLVTGCHDGIVRRESRSLWSMAWTDPKWGRRQVRVFDLRVSSKGPIHHLRGHQQRVFNTIWSPLLPDVLASGSDDKTIRVWNVGSETSSVFEGHHDRVRALLWSYEVR